ncbi:two-component system, sporulation sensor kinase A [Paenibacillus sp. yr247]|uniref:PAS domain-containing sensor histidine kinase n=1 Tax=Paenibacillus sp. yr247 TaxID=1761880 RepID=UPI000891A307|nr:PAS domain-containing sensor histidine kinase [Paenibacillus sp. yr247]SDM80872.1 two-component system, sporulation sensor kinase A [Paenibacillus sp. yr247]
MEKRSRKLESKVLSTNLMKQMNNIFDLYFNNTNVSVAVIDLNFQVLMVNKAYEKLYGWSNDEVIGEALSTVPSHVIEQVKNVHHSVIRTGQAQSYETLKLRKDGDSFHASVTVSPLKDNIGHIFALVEVARDISIRKMEDEKLKESEERYRNLVELSPEPIVVYSDSIIVYANPAALKLVGAEDERQLLGISALDFIHPDYVNELQTQVEYLLKEKKPSDIIEKNIVRLDKQIINVEIRAVPIDYLGKPSIQLLCRDITHKKVMESIVRERDEEYRRMLKLLPEPIIVHQEGIICYINDVGLKLLGGQSLSDIIGKTIYEFIHPDYHDTVKERVISVVLVDTYNPFIELSLLGINGEKIAIEASSVVLHSYLERPVIQTVLRNITERKNAEEMLRQSEKLSVVGQLAAGIAHEIRNPLTSLVGFLQLIKSASHKKVLEYADIMLVELNRINTIVNEFMLIAKPQSSKFEDKNLYEITGNVVALLQPQALLHNVEINFENKNDVVYIVKCDEGQLKQVFINLIKNSVEAMPYGGRIEIALQRLGRSRMLIKLKDNGVGIAEELVPRLGDPFFTTKEEGTGLGLMVCYRIIEAHQGTMKVYSKLGLGTTIEIELPYVV